MIEGSVSIPLTNGSGSGSPKNTWIRWIRNTGQNQDKLRLKTTVLCIRSHPKLFAGSGVNHSGSRKLRILNEFEIKLL